MRLIDADELKSKIQKSNCNIEHLWKNVVLDVIDNCKTAYDVDEVVSNLENLKSMVPVNRLLDDVIKDKPKELGQLIAYDKAIKIVKDGGVKC